MKNFLVNKRLILVGIVAGGILGYAYYYFIGCSSGSCAITSKPVNSSVYGMVMGYALVSVFKKTKTSTDA